MAEVSQESPIPPLDLARGQLERALWAEARDSFERALAREETPEAVEGLSWAAWWLDDAAVVMSARERAYRLYRRRGDPAGAARMAIWLTIDQLDFHGAVAVASGWLARARRLLAPLAPAPEHGWLAFLEGYLAHLGGDSAAGEELARTAGDLGRSLAVADLEMLGLALEGASLVARARVEEGMRLLDEAAATALEGEASVPISGAWVCCFLVTACEAVRDYGRAAQWCDRIEEFARRYGSRYMLAFCRAEYGAVQLWRGRWGEAEALLEASIEDFAHSRPALAGAPLAGLAELRRCQGRGEEALALLDRTGPGARAQLCRARLALDGGRTARAADLAERVLRQLAPERGLERVPALELVARARTARGELERAGAALAALREVAGRVGTAPLRAAADLAEGALASAAGDHQRARRLLEDAVDGFERSGGAFEAAGARVELAVALLALGRPGAAGREAGAALARLRELGAAGEAERARRVLTACGEGGRPAPSPVTAREREVLALLAEGLTNGQIAARLVVSEHTVHRHVANILRKLDMPSRAAAAAHAVRRGLVAGPSG